ncbi:MAG: hypothetical protein JWQ72_3069 [Polaromonas sp.]|nr:hypothetical protein [Polaromonas sp.]
MPIQHVYRIACVLGLLALGACGDPPGWQQLLTGRITQQYPAYTVSPAAGGGLLVERPGMAAVPVDVEAIARFCLRGPKDCDYATDQLLLQLGAR